MAPPCEVRVLGKITVTFADGREPVTRFRTRKAALLLAYLALHAGQAQAREALVALLWPELDPKAGRDNLSTALSVLRRQLEADTGPRLLESDHTTVRLNPEAATVDAARFEALVKRGRHPRLSQSERRAALDTALALWQPPLPGIYDDWAVDAQTRLEALADEAGALRETLPEVAPDEPTPENAADPIPATLSRFLGRDQDRAALREHLAQHRLVTLLGPGGVGKTRLSLETARTLGDAFERRVFVSLAELPSPTLLVSSVRNALTGAPPAPDPLEQVVGCINAVTGKVLMVLDNLEHLLPSGNDDDAEKTPFGPAPVVRQLLSRCPRLTVLTTSRQPLGVEGEQLFPVDLIPLETAVALFVDRARAVRPDFTRHAGNAAEIEGVCGLLDGLPLAIELAAAWARVLTLTELRQRLEGERLRLGGRRRDLSPRQRSLEATLRWSWQLLPPPQKRLLAALSVFRGGWSLDAAEAVSDDPEALLDLFELIDKSLVRVEPAGAETRYRLLETVRQFAQERLDESGEGDAVRTRHVDHYAALTLPSPAAAAWMARLDREQDNLRAALEFVATAPGRAPQALALSAAMGRYWRTYGHLTEGREWYARILARPDALPPTRERADALHGAGMLAEVQTDFDSALACNTESLRIREALGDRKGVAASLNSLGNALFSQRNYAAARDFHERSLALRRTLGDPAAIAVALNNLGNVAHGQGDIPAARAYHEEGLALKRSLGDLGALAYSLVNLGNLALESGDLATAAAHYVEAVAIRHAQGDRFNAVVSLQAVAGVTFRTGDGERAVTLWSAVKRLQGEIDAANPPVIEARYREQIAEVRTTLGESRFEAAWEAGQALSWEQAAALALTP